MLDEPATAKALAWYLKRGVDCGALGADEIVERTGLRPAELTAIVTRPLGG